MTNRRKRICLSNIDISRTTARESQTLKTRAWCEMPKDSKFSKTVLLVDDLDLMRKMVRDFLESLGMEVLEASNATQAIHIARSHPGKIDLLLTDVEMPGMSGLMSANQIAGLKPGIRIVCMSAGTSQQEWAHREGKPVGTYFLQKPFRLEELKALLMAIFSE